MKPSSLARRAFSFLLSMSNPASSIAIVENPEGRRTPPALPGKRFSIPVGNKVKPTGSAVLRVVLALLLTVGLLVFLAVMRLEFGSNAPVLTVRSLDRIDPVSLPAPPPPPQAETPPPPPPQTDLPKLDLQIDPVAPPVKANIDQDVDLDLSFADFAPQNDSPREAMTFNLADLDSQPRLVNTPSVKFPEAQRNRGVTEGRVTVEVYISSAGRVTIKRILSSSHEDFTAMARSFVTKARFTPPKKDGRPVNATFKWPLILNP